MQLRDALLACRDARAWSLSDASTWWAQHRDEIEGLVAEERRSVSGNADTVAVAAAGRARIASSGDQRASE